MVKENRSKFAILGMLEICPMSGYDIRKFAAMSIAHFWKEDYGHIYPTLKVLVAEGLASRVEEAHAGKVARHLYSITEAGRKSLAAWLVERPNPPNLRVELLLKVFLGSRIEPERLIPMLEEEAGDCAAARAELEKTETHLLGMIEAGGEEGRAARYQLMTLRYGKSYYGNLGAWCSGVADELRAP
jgi:DNA-binding PadR family transcriptional regulator